MAVDIVTIDRFDVESLGEKGQVGPDGDKVDGEGQEKDMISDVTQQLQEMSILLDRYRLQSERHRRLGPKRKLWELYT